MWRVVFVALVVVWLFELVTWLLRMACHCRIDRAVIIVRARGPHLAGCDALNPTRESRHAFTLEEGGQFKFNKRQGGP